MLALAGIRSSGSGSAAAAGSAAASRASTARGVRVLMAGSSGVKWWRFVPTGPLRQARPPGQCHVMDLATLARLLSPAGRALLAEAVALGPREQTYLAGFNRLSKRHPADLVRAALETAILRQRARAKFADAERMYFTREALEQASGDVVARHRARRFAGFAVV